MTFSFPVRVRYHEVDAQGVVFNAWYLVWFDEAFTAFLEARGVAYRAMLDAGYDVQLVHTELDWAAGIGFHDSPVVAVTCPRLGRTSFDIAFEVRRDGEVTCTGRTTYVVVATDGSGKRELPGFLREALGHSA
ncbi:MAG: acyl-CoA thioesterase [Sporichthyaceae bacterium]